MFIIRSCFFILIIGTCSVFAAEHGHATIMDLKWPVINSIVLFGFLAWKLKAPVKKYFDENAVKVKKLYDLAEEKDKEAQIKLGMYEEKLNNIRTTIHTIEQNAIRDAELFAEDQRNETREKVARLQVDIQNKLEYKRATLIQELQTDLVDAVIQKTKNSIGADSVSKENAATKLLSKLEA